MKALYLLLWLHPGQAPTPWENFPTLAACQAAIVTEAKPGREYQCATYREYVDMVVRAQKHQ